MKRVNLYLTDEQVAFMEQYATEQGVLATRGRNVGQPDMSAVMRIAIDKLQGCQPLKAGATFTGEWDDVSAEYLVSDFP